MHAVGSGRAPGGMGGFEGSLALLHAAAVAGTKMVAVMAAIAAFRPTDCHWLSGGSL